VWAVRAPRSIFAVLVTCASCVLGHAACSSESGLVGNGACDGYCAKVAGATCTHKASNDQCIAKCVFYQNDANASADPTDPTACSVANSKMIRCATIDGNVGCDGGSGYPQVVDCQPDVDARAAACRPWIVDDGGLDESGP